MNEWMRGGAITLCLAAVLFLLGAAADNDGLQTASLMAAIVGVVFVAVAVAKGSPTR